MAVMTRSPRLRAAVARAVDEAVKFEHDLASGRKTKADCIASGELMTFDAWFSNLAAC